MAAGLPSVFPPAIETRTTSGGRVTLCNTHPCNLGVGRNSNHFKFFIYNRWCEHRNLIFDLINPCRLCHRDWIMNYLAKPLKNSFMFNEMPPSGDEIGQPGRWRERKSRNVRSSMLTNSPGTAAITWLIGGDSSE